jgi:hypothetical protein
MPLVSGFLSCGEPSRPLEPRGCDTPASSTTITALEIGAADGDFVPSARATPTIGGQGISMLGYRIAVQASTPVTCIALTSEPHNLIVTASGDWFVSDPIWIIEEGTTIDVVVEAYGMRIERTMRSDVPDSGAL